MASVEVLPPVQIGRIFGVSCRASEALSSGAGMDAPEYLVTGSMVREGVEGSEYIFESARLRPGYRARCRS